MRVVVELTQREADDLMRSDLEPDVSWGWPPMDEPIVSLPDGVATAVGKLRDAIVRAETFAKAHP